MEGSDSVQIYTDEGGTIDMTQLKEGAISAAKTITIATKAIGGKGGSVDLRGVSGKIFKAGEKIEIYADQILTDAGVSFKDLADSPNVVVAPGRVIYRVDLSVQKLVVGDPGSKVTIPLKVINAGPKVDEYALSITNSAGWYLTITSKVTIGGLYYKILNLNINFPANATPASANKITVTATSKTDPSVSVKTEFIAFVKGTDSDNDGVPDNTDAFPDDPVEFADSDNDSTGNNTDLDDDNDGMTDECETKYMDTLNPFENDASQDADNDGYTNLEECNAGTDPINPASKPGNIQPQPLPNPDDSVVISGSGGYKTFVTPITNGTQAEMQVTQESDDSFRGNNGTSSIAVIPDSTATGDTFTFTTGKNLTDDGNPISLEVKPDADGSLTYKDPANPSTSVTVYTDNSYTVTDTQEPGTVISGKPDGTQIITDTEYPGMSYTVNTDGTRMLRIRNIRECLTTSVQIISIRLQTVNILE